MIGVRLAEDLVNLDVDGRWDAQHVGDALRHRLVRLDSIDGEELAELHRWAGRLHEAFLAPAAAERCALLNALLADGVQRVHLVAHDDLPAHLHFAGADADLPQRVKAMTAGGLAVFATETGASRMGACPRPGCGRVFADTSRNGRRVYCSARCGNTAAVDRYRRRDGRAA